MRTLDAATQTAIGSRSAIRPVNFILVAAKELDGDPVTFGFTDYGEDVATNYVDALTGSTVAGNFYGDNSPIIEIDRIPLHIDLTIDTVQVVMNILHPQVENLFRGHNVRDAAVQIHRGWLNASEQLVAAIRARFTGFVDQSPINTAAAGGLSEGILRVVSTARELTRTGSFQWSDESQKLRSGDRMCQYVGIAGDVPYWWGEQSKTTFA